MEVTRVPSFNINASEEREVVGGGGDKMESFFCNIDRQPLQQLAGRDSAKRMSLFLTGFSSWDEN